MLNVHFSCGYPMCSERCSKVTEHRDYECKIFKQKGYKADGKNFDFKSKKMNLIWQY